MTRLDRSILELPPAEVYKADRRSRVWRVDLPAERGGPVVIKRFKYSPLRQALAWALGFHPAQRERRVAFRLRALGLPVADILAIDVEWSLRGVRAWLATPWLGRSLHNRLRDGELSDPARRRQVATAVGELTGKMATWGLLNRDHKSSNVILDDEDRLWLIDVSAVRRVLREERAAVLERMLVSLQRSTRAALASRTDRLRVLRAAVRACPGLVEPRTFMLQVMRALIQ